MKQNHTKSQQLLTKATAAHQAGQLQRAEKLYLTIKSQGCLDPIFFNNFACLLMSRGKIKQAKYYFEQASKLKSDYADPYNNLGNVYKANNQFSKARHYYQKAIEIKKDYADPYNNLGLLELQLGNYKNAMSQFTQCLDLQSKHIDAINNLSNCFINLGKPLLAKELLEKHQVLVMQHASLCYQAGHVFSLLQDLPTAREYYINCLQLNNCTTELKCMSLMQLLHCQLQLGNWLEFSNLQQMAEQTIKQCLERKITELRLDPFVATMLDFSGKTQTQIHQAAAKKYAMHIKALPSIQITEKKIYRIGYISPDFNQHPITLQLQDSLRYHSNNQFKTYAYMIGNQEDQYSEIIKGSVNQYQAFKPYQANHAETVAKQIRLDEIDFLIDLSGYTKYSAMPILAYRPAPCQLHMLGYATSLQADYIDYFIADPFLVTPENRNYFSEKILTLPSLHIMPEMQMPKLDNKRQDYGLCDNQFIFCAFCKTYRITPETFSMWMKILQQTPNSVLWLYAETEEAILNLQTTAQQQFGVAPERIIFLTQTNTTSHFAHHLADLFLDTHPISGGTNSLLAVHANLPVLTWVSNNPVTRVTGSMNHRLGLNELITESKQAYINKAVDLANHKEQLAHYKTVLRNNKSTLFDPKLYIQTLEHELLAIVSGHHPEEQNESK